ncbi:MAG: sensor domain-containing protein, partial [Mycobacterium sp.]
LLTRPSTRTGPPLTAAALDGLLLTPDQANSAMGVTGLTVDKTATTMDDDTDNVSDQACLAMNNAADATVYAGSGFSAMREQELLAGPPPHLVEQAVVLFSSAHDADAFFTASSRSWPACANRQYTDTSGGQPLQIMVGPVSNTNGTLSATLNASFDGTPIIGERVLTVANNVVIDIATANASAPGAALKIARQIADKVSKAS